MFFFPNIYREFPKHQQLSGGWGKVKEKFINNLMGGWGDKRKID